MEPNKGSTSISATSRDACTSKVDNLNSIASPSTAQPDEEKTTVKIVALMNKDHGILWELPAGKPDGNQLLINPLDDQRKRVFQSTQKSDTCTYYAFKCLRAYYGKNCGTFKSERILEKLFSEYRKKLIFHCRTESLAKFINNTILSNIHAIKPTNLEDTLLFYKKMLYSPEFNNESIAELIIEAKKMLHEICKEDLMSDCNFQNFIERRKREMFIPIQQDFFENQFKLSAEDIYRRLYDCTKPSEEINQLINKFSISDAYHFFHQGLLFSYVNKIGFKASNWSPNESIDLIIQDLKIHGPLLGAGKLGKLFYESAPDKLKEQIGGRSIWGWKPGTYVPREGLHCVVVVGAEKALKTQHIYIIDPNDPSDPANPETRKIYKISYERFISGSCHFWCFAENFYAAKPGHLLYNSNLPNFTPILQNKC